MIASTMKAAMAAMVVGCALAKPTRQVHVNEGYDVLLTPDQFSKLKPGSLHGMAGKCVFNEENKFVNENLDTIEDCLKWCVNENVVVQGDIGACEYNENDEKCTAFNASAFEDSKVTSSENDAGYTCYSLFPDGNRRSARGLRVSKFWPNNELIYDIVDASDPNSWESNGHSQSSAIEYIDRAIAEYHAKTNIRFVKRTTEARYVSVGFFGGGCSSYVGNVFGGQQVTLGWCRSSLGSIIHEFGHALGMWHEHTRADRDTFLNVPSGANGNFNIANTNSRGIKYDFGSIMHYPLRTRWSDGTGTIVMTLTTEGTTRRSEQGNPTIGQRAGLSQLDVDGLATVYPDLGVSRSPTFPPPTRSPTVFSLYTVCAAEGGNCECVGVVRYGANGQFAYQQSTGSIACTNGVFGDPIPGTRKNCYCPATSSPTPSPSTSNSTPSPTPSPSTSAPTPSPTPSPSTSAPTPSPTPSPSTSNPTPSPTPSPSTSNPTPAPTPSPSTSNPTPSPTPSPSTSAPSTSNPTPAPTPSPSTSNPTPSPTPSPSTSAPTPSPIPSPSTSAPTPSTSTSTSTSGFRFAAKGRGNNDNKNGAYAEEDNRFAVRCCSDTRILGWTRTCNSNGVTESDAWDAGCQSKKTFSEAEDFCASVGGRLCTKAEVLGGCVKGTGCNFDRKLIWTSSVETAPAPTPPPCKSWCATNSKPWGTKCDWKNCRGCNQCNA